MNLEQVKEIIRKPWVKVPEDGGGGIAGKQEQPGVRSRPGACVSMRVPVRITIRNSSGAAEIHSARTILLNQNGARFEYTFPSGQQPFRQNPFHLHQGLWIEVLSTAKAAGGRVSWADARPNREGNFEFAVEMYEPRNLFDPSLPQQAGESSVENPPGDAPSGPAAEPASQRQRPRSLPGGTLPMTNRLAEVLKEVIESALQEEKDAASERLVKEVQDQVGQTQQAAVETLRKEITQQVSVMEDQLLQQCRSRTEQLLSTIMKTSLHALSNQIDEMAATTEERIQKIFSDLGNQLEQRSAKALAETSSRMEEQMEKSAKDIHGTIVQNVLKELHEKQKDMMGQLQQQIGMATEQNLVKLRGGLTRALQELTQASQNGDLAF